MEDCKKFLFQTINALIKIQSEKNGNKLALLNSDKRKISYSELAIIVSHLSTDIVKKLSSTQNQINSPRLAIVFKNGIEMSILMLSAIKIGIAMPLNPNYHARELVYYLEELKPDVILTDIYFDHDLNDLAVKLKIKLINIGPAIKKLINKKSKISLDNFYYPEKKPDDVAVILLTSGSTGKSKKVPLTHKNICSSVAEICATLKLTGSDLCLSMWEQFHIGGLVDLLLVPLASGGSILCTNGFNVKKFFQYLEEFNPTWFQAVPTSYIEILKIGKRNHFNFEENSLKFLRSVASALPYSTHKELEEKFKKPVIQTFGMTEAAPLITSNLLPPKKRKIGSVGRLLSTEVAIMDTNGKILNCEETGEVVIKGLNIFSGYENNQKENEFIFRYGWFHTGDLGYLDKESFLFLTGRIKEQINRGGEKISPQEIDDALLEHPGIHQCASFSLPHTTLGEEVGVAVVPSNIGITENEIKQFLITKLSKFKIPKKIMILEKLPMNAIGKIERSSLSILSQQKEHHEPKSASLSNIEKLLSIIWQTELELENLNIEDDFVSIGGDSLSSLRLMASIEKILGLKLSLDDLDSYQTIKLMAEYLKNKKNFSEKKAMKILSELNKGSIRKFLYLTSNYDSYDFTKIFLETFNFNKYKLAIEALLNDASPREVLEIIKYSDFNIKDKSNTLEIKKYTKWSSLNKERITNIRFNKSWTKSILDKNIFLYKTKNNKLNNLLVGFCGNHMRLMMPTFLFLGSLEDGLCDVLLLRDSSRLHYINGVDKISADLETLSDWLNNFIKKNNYNKVISIGTSAGGLASLGIGLRNQWHKSIAICPESPIVQPVLSTFIESNKIINTHTALKIFIGNGVERDKSSAHELIKLLPEIDLTIDPDCDTHLYLWNLFERNKFVDFLNNELFNNF